MAGHPVVESSEGPPYPGGHHLGLRSKQEGFLDFRLINNDRGPGVSPLPTKNPVEMCLSNTSLLKICHDCRKVVIRCGKEPPNVFERRQHIQGSLVGMEGEFDRLLLLLPHTLEFML